VQVDPVSGPRFWHSNGPYSRAVARSSIDDMSTATIADIPVRLDFDAHAMTFAKALSHLDHAATKELDRVGFDHRLRELVRLRVSQLNGCAYCIDMHSQTARAVGETEQRLYALPAWREAPFFSDVERAALAFAESMTRMADDHVPTSAFDAVAVHYSPDEIAALVSLVVTVTAWNAIGVSTRAWPPGSYQP
jgi:AhpD family alkylhydroperoxidase